MKYLLNSLVGFAMCSLPLMSCSDDPVMVGEAGSGGDGTGGTAGAGGMTGTGGMGGAGATRVRSVQFTGIGSNGMVALVEDVELCQADTDNCGMSNALGVASIDVPVDQELTFTAEREGYTSIIWGDVSDIEWEQPTVRRLYTDAQMTEIMEQQLGGNYPPTAGVIGLVRFPTHTAGGVTFTAVGDSANEVGNSFYFDGTTEEYGTEHAATGPYDGLGYLLPLGDGGFMSVTEGVQTFELGGTGGDCPVSWGWPGDTPTQIRVPVRNGFRTYGSWNCEL
jgi:hypothetical protein